MVCNQSDPAVSSKVRIAAFDFDGTCIKGNSPVMLVRHLKRNGMIRKRILSKILLWAAAYKLRLPQEEAWVRGLVFTAFEGMDKKRADQFLMDFYDSVIELGGRFRAQAHQTMERLQADGVEVLIVSATFEPIVRRAVQCHPVDGQLATHMAVDSEGRYITRVEGECIEGEAKVRAIKEYADAKYGEGAWELSHAFGDHHSDAAMLSAAVHPFAVNPDNPLSRCAKRNGWTILEWSDDPAPICIP